MSHPRVIVSIPSWGVTSSLRHIHTTSPSSLPINLNSQLKVVNPKPKKPKYLEDRSKTASAQKAPARRRTGPNNKRTWKDHIGTLRHRVYSRLAEEDRDWHLRLSRYNKDSWKNYVQRVYYQDGLREEFGKPSDWLADRFGKNRYPGRHQRPEQTSVDNEGYNPPDSIQSEERYRDISRQERKNWDSREFESETQQRESKYKKTPFRDHWRNIGSPERSRQTTPFSDVQDLKGSPG